MASAASVFVFSLFTWLSSLLTVAGEDICSSTTYVYDDVTGNNEPMVSFKSCHWGCCYKYGSPCCSPPVGLIVGCVVGGFLLLAALVGGLCCCYCYCCRRMESQQAAGAMAVRYPRPHPGAGTVHITATAASSSSAANGPPGSFPASLPPRDPSFPPSYEEAIAGEVNPAYKPDPYIPPL